MNISLHRNLPLKVTFFAGALMLFALSFSFALAANDDASIVGTPSITESTALGIANKAYTGNGVFTDIELEMENNVLVFAIEYTEKDGNEVDVKVNAKTGAVVLVESDANETVDDDANDTKEDEKSEKIANMQVLLNLLTQLVALLRAQGV